LRNRVHRHVGSAVGFLLERDRAGFQRKQRMILAKADIGAGMPLGAALTNEDVAGEHGLAAELLHAKASAIGIAAVARRTASFLVCHVSSPVRRPGASHSVWARSRPVSSRGRQST